MKNKIYLLILLAFVGVIVFVGRSKLAAVFYHHASNYYEEKLYKEAIDYFNRSLKLNPAVSDAHYGLGNAYFQEKLEDKAVEEYNKAIQLDAKFILAYEALADIYLRRKLYQESLDTLKKAEAALPQDKKIKELLDYVSSEYAGYLMRESVKAFADSDKTKAYELAEKALELNPDFAYTRYLMGYLYYSDRRYEQAMAMLEEAIRLKYDFAMPHKLLGDIYFEKGIFDKAINEYNIAALANNGDPMLLNNLGLAFMNLEKYDQALSFLKQAVSLAPDNVNFRYALASVYRDLSRFKEAASEYAKVISAKPDYPNVHNDLGDIYRGEGRMPEALEEYRSEIRLCQAKLAAGAEDPFVLNDAAYAYNRTGDYAKAKALIDKALSIEPGYRQAYLTLAEIQKNLGNSREALAALEKAKALSKGSRFYIDKAINDMNELKALAEQKQGFKR